MAPRGGGAERRLRMQRLYITAARRAPRLMPRAAIDAATQAFAATAAPGFAVHFAPALAVYAAPAPVIEYMAPALVLSQAQSFENIVGSSECWFAQDTETWDLFLCFREGRCSAWRWVHLTMPILCLRCLWPRPWSTSLPSLIWWSASNMSRD